MVRGVVNQLCWHQVYGEVWTFVFVSTQPAAAKFWIMNAPLMVLEVDYVYWVLILFFVTLKVFLFNFLCLTLCFSCLSFILKSLLGNKKLVLMIEMDYVYWVLSYVVDGVLILTPFHFCFSVFFYSGFDGTSIK